MGAAEKIGDTQIEQSRFKVPESIIDRSDRHRTDPRTAEIANRSHHARPDFSNTQGASADHGRLQVGVNQLCRRDVGKGVPDAHYAE